MSTIPARSIALIFCLLLSFAAAKGQTDELGRWVHGRGEPWWFNSNQYTEEQAAAARNRWQQLEAQLGSAQEDWAGDYGVGGGEGTYIDIFRWTPEGGYVSFGVSLCEANVRTLDYGEVTSVSPSHVVLISKRLPQSQNARTLVKVKWGERHYLIDEHDVANFCDYVAGLGAHNKPEGYVESNFLSRSEDYDKPTAVLPAVPPEYRQHVRRPIDARISKVGRSYVEVDPENEWYNDIVTPVTLNAGSDQGLKRGMALHILDSDEFDEKVEITRVGGNYAQGIIVRSVRKRPGTKINEWDDGQDAPQQPISVGWRLTTSLHKQMLRLDDRIAAWEAKQNKR